MENAPQTTQRKPVAIKICARDAFLIMRQKPSVWQYLLAIALAFFSFSSIGLVGFSLVVNKLPKVHFISMYTYFEVGRKFIQCFDGVYKSLRFIYACIQFQKQGVNLKRVSIRLETKGLNLYERCMYVFSVQCIFDKHGVCIQLLQRFINSVRVNCKYSRQRYIFTPHLIKLYFKVQRVQRYMKKL